MGTRPNELDTKNFLHTSGPDVRVTGLRIRGPDPDIHDDCTCGDCRYCIPISRGIVTYHPMTVDNCELSGFAHTAIGLWPGARVHAHHNDIHHNRRTGLGYGVSLCDDSSAVVEANRFDYNRHSIASCGTADSSYEARYNLVLDSANGHAFDVHGGTDRGDGTLIASDFTLIHHNTFRATSVPAFVLRGIPVAWALVHHNWFLHSTIANALEQSNADGGMFVCQNTVGPDRVLTEGPGEWLESRDGDGQ